MLNSYDWPTGETGIAVTDAKQLAREAEEWSRLPEAEIDAAVALLSLDPQNLPEPVHRYWEVERLSYRLLVRPFPAIDGKLLIMPWAAEATQELFLVYFQDSRLPYVDSALPPSAAAALKRHRQKRNLQLEAEPTAVARYLGLPHRANWTIQEAQAAGMATCLARSTSSSPTPPDAGYGSARSRIPKPPSRQRLWAATSNASSTVRAT